MERTNLTPEFNQIRLNLSTEDGFRYSPISSGILDSEVIHALTEPYYTSQPILEEWDYTEETEEITRQDIKDFFFSVISEEIPTKRRKICEEKLKLFLAKGGKNVYFI